MSPEYFQKSRLYAFHTLFNEIVKIFYYTVISTIVIHYEFLVKIWNLSEYISIWKNEEVISCFWNVISLFFATIIELPFDIFTQFILEEKYELNKKSLKCFVLDQFKLFLFAQIFHLPVCLITVFIIKNGGKKYLFPFQKENLKIILFQGSGFLYCYG